MKFSRLFYIVLAVLVCVSSSQQTAAQGYTDALLRQIQSRNSVSQYSSRRFQNQATSRAVGRIGVAGINARPYNSSAKRRSKPFSSLDRGPSVSPYLALSNSFNQVSDYYNIVRPQQDFQRARERQQRENARIQSQIRANEHRLNQMAAQAPFHLRGDPELAPTGHSATYLFYDNFQSTGNYFTPIQGLEKQR